MARTVLQAFFSGGSSGFDDTGATSTLTTGVPTSGTVTRIVGGVTFNRRSNAGDPRTRRIRAAFYVSGSHPLLSSDTSVRATLTDYLWFADVDMNREVTGDNTSMTALRSSQLVHLPIDVRGQRVLSSTLRLRRQVCTIGLPGASDISDFSYWLRVFILEAP